MSLAGEIISSGMRTYSAKIYRKSSTGYETTATATIDCIYYTGTTAKMFVKESMRPTVDGVLVFDPDVITTQSIYHQDWQGAKISLCDIDIGGSVNHTGGYSTGALKMTVDGFDESHRYVQRNDTFTIPTETGTPVHTVTIRTPTGNSGTTSIDFTPALASNILDDAVINLTPILYQFAVIYPDNVALQDDVIAVPVKAL